MITLFKRIPTTIKRVARCGTWRAPNTTPSFQRVTALVRQFALGALPGRREDDRTQRGTHPARARRIHIGAPLQGNLLCALASNAWVSHQRHTRALPLPQKLRGSGHGEPWSQATAQRPNPAIDPNRPVAASGASTYHATDSQAKPSIAREPKSRQEQRRKPGQLRAWDPADPSQRKLENVFPRARSCSLNKPSGLRRGGLQ